MENNFQPNSGAPDLPPSLDQTSPDQPAPAENQQPSQVQSEQPNQQPNQPPVNQPLPGATGVNLESPILAPTHFDGMAPLDPALIPQNPQAQNQQPQKPELTPEQKKLKTYMILAIVFGAVALISIFLGIFALVASIETGEKLTRATYTIGVQKDIISAVEEDTGKTIKTREDVPAYAPVSGYVYVSQWGIKLQIPDDLSNLSYIVNANDFDRVQSICFNGTKKGVAYFPDFANISLNPGGMGCLHRVASHEGESDKNTGYSYGEKVFTYDNYSYFYAAPSRTYSSDEANAGLESTAVQIIKNMISKNIGHYE